jgi:hypothetical protein
MAFTYNETPSVLAMTRNLSFNQVTWLNKAKFLECLAEGKQIFPNIEHMKFLGKSSPVSSSWYRERTQPEVIGNVVRNSNGDWILHISYGCHTREILEDFSVLYIEDSDCFTWSRSHSGRIPKYAMRGAITEEYHYIGRSIPDLESTHLNTQPPSYFEQNEYGQVRKIEFNQTVPFLFGKFCVLLIVY